MPMIRAVSLLVGLVTSGAAWAEPQADTRGAFGVEKLEAEAGASLSVVGTSTPAGTGGPTLIRYGLHAGATYRVWEGVGVGAQLGFAWIRQLSDPEALVGNRRGTRWWIGLPAVSYGLGRFRLTAALEWLGGYDLSNPTVFGGELGYGSPLGAHLAASYPVRGLWGGLPGKLLLGARVDWTGFSSASDGAGGEAELSEDLQLWAGGLSLGWRF